MNIKVSATFDVDAAKATWPKHAVVVLLAKVETDLRRDFWKTNFARLIDVREVKDKD